MAMQRLMIGFRLHGAPHTGDVDEDKHKRSNYQLLVAPGFFHFDLLEDFASQNRALFVGVLS